MPDKPEEQTEQKQEPEQQNGVENGQEEEEVVRELSQTDRLNKRLLSSFLERMNSNDGLLQRFASTNNNQATSQEQSTDEFAS